MLEALQASIGTCGDTIPVVENKSVCYYDGHGAFFAELLPMSGYIRLLIPVAFDEVDDPKEWQETSLLGSSYPTWCIVNVACILTSTEYSMSRQPCAWSGRTSQAHQTDGDSNQFYVGAPEVGASPALVFHGLWKC